MEIRYDGFPFFLSDLLQSHCAWSPFMSIHTNHLHEIMKSASFFSAKTKIKHMMCGVSHGVSARLGCQFSRSPQKANQLRLRTVLMV